MNHVLTKKCFFAVFCLFLNVSEKSFSNDSIFKQVGDYKIFFSAFSTDFIPADIASKYQIVRATDRGLVNISIMKEFAEGVPAIINGSVSNILQQTQILEFFPVREGKSLYYLAPFKFDNEDYLTFSIRINEAEGSNIPSYRFKFQKKMYTD